MEYTENMTFEEASHALMKDLKTRLADLHEHFDAENVDWYKLICHWRNSFPKKHRSRSLVRKW